MTLLLEMTDADRPGAHSWVRKMLGIAMEGEQTNYIWGVIDIIPHTNFPDIRNKSVIHSENGSCMIIPREGDKVRLYIQLSEKDNVYDFATGRVDKSRFGPRQILEVNSCTTCCDLWKSYHFMLGRPENSRTVHFWRSWIIWLVDHLHEWVAFSHRSSNV